MTGDTTVKRVRIHDKPTTITDKVNAIAADDDEGIKIDEQSLDRLYVCMGKTSTDTFELYTLELINDDNTPTSILRQSMVQTRNGGRLQ